MPMGHIMEKLEKKFSFYGNAYGGTPPYSWHWDFGDGTSSNERNPKHAYWKVRNLYSNTYSNRWERN